MNEIVCKINFRCEHCARYNNYSAKEKAAHKKEYDHHQNSKEIVRKLLRKSIKAAKKKNSRILTLHFDLQKILTTPKTSIGPVYYLSKLNVWNFTIYNLQNHDGLCNVSMNQTIGKRGSDEIASFLYMYTQGFRFCPIENNRPK